MTSVTYMLIILLLLPIALFIAEFFLAARHPKAGLVLPLIAMCAFVWSGYYALIQGVILYSIYFVVQVLEKKKQEQKIDQADEIKRMNIRDL